LFIYFLQGITFGLAATATPGPFKAFLMTETAKNGWLRTLPTALVPIVTDGPIILLVMLVLTQTSTLFLTLLQVVGGGFILYLAWGAWRTLTQPTPLQSGGQTVQRSFRNAVLMNFLNPNPYIFWSVIAGPILLEGWRHSPGWGMIFILGMYGTFILGLSAFIIIFGMASRLGPKVSRGISAVAFVMLLGFGLYQIWQGAQQLIGGG